MNLRPSPAPIPGKKILRLRALSNGSRLSLRAALRRRNRQPFPVAHRTARISISVMLL